MNGGPPGDINRIFEQFFGGAMNMGDGSDEGNMFDLGGNPHIKIFRNGRPMNTQTFTKPPPVEKKINITLEQAFSGFTLDLDSDIDGGDKIKIEVPPGIEHDEVIILPDKGIIHKHNESLRGDIHLHFVIDKHNVFERRNLDLFCKKTITLKEALCGFTVMIQHLSGKSIRISNQKQNIVHPGFQRELITFGMKRDDTIGKLIIQFDVEFPTSLTTEQKDQLEIIF